MRKITNNIMIPRDTLNSSKSSNMTREDYIDEFIRHGSDLIPYNTPNYDEVLLERANKYADEMLNPNSKLDKLCEWHDSLIDSHSSDVEEQEDKEPIDNILYAAACGIKNMKEHI